MSSQASKTGERWEWVINADLKFKQKKIKKQGDERTEIKNKTSYMNKVLYYKQYYEIFFKSIKYMNVGR